ncbi:hypothetical protein CN184_28425 [Sinorhizobium medicae]|uniref:hypothetical protein n=1 Tax=Sinorhizobium medicae TaxID=110321 RepID=UPI000FD5D62F|nr:hypothetical protein [Sinorhizobium medicae]RVJ16519.1 hypothetical protein CN184_28425 [Sinorhizobium medicae]
MESVYNHADSRQVADKLNFVIRMLNGMSGGSITLANSVTTTTVINAAVTPDSKITLTATSAAAATENPQISSKSNGSFVITHASATTTRTFDYVVIAV